MLNPQKQNVRISMKQFQYIFQRTKLRMCSIAMVKSRLNLFTKDIMRKDPDVWKLCTMPLNYKSEKI